VSGANDARQGGNREDLTLRVCLGSYRGRQRVSQPTPLRRHHCRQTMCLGLSRYGCGGRRLHILAGSSRGLTLSLLLDRALRLHPQPRACIENHLPACTVGNRHQHSRMAALIAVIRGIVEAADPHRQLG